MTTRRGLGCLVFDIDDTLYLEQDYVRSGFHACDRFLRTRGIDGFGQSAWRAFELGIRGNTFDVALRDLGIDPSRELISRLVACYRRHIPTIGLLPDALDCLEALYDRYHLCAVTDGNADSQRAKVAALGLTRWLDPIVITSEHGTHFAKPSTAPFLQIENVSRHAPASCWYIADNPTKDFAGPKALQWNTARVRRDGGLHERLLSGPDVDIEIASLHGLVEALQNRAKVDSPQE